MDPAFDKSAFTLTSEDPVSDIVKSEFGFHIIKLIEAQETETLPLSEVKSQIEVALKAEKTKELYDNLYQRLSEVAFESPLKAHILLIRDMVVESCYRRVSSETIGPIQKFTSMKLLQMPCVVT